MTGQGAGTDSYKPPSRDRRQTHHQEDAPESPENNSRVSFVRLQGQTLPIHQSAGREREEEGSLAALGRRLSWDPKVPCREVAGPDREPAAPQQSLVEDPPTSRGPSIKVDL